ncbi:hypothetical protein [Pareuzebyella sediminis]|uniref:hypothetical protein n=1 Tax=Pareuzebyella sediminis TaxID=2607998 RepID=UPI0011F08A0A|nr:hypothetical protein [Pareuzebyella sediminis]
MKQLRKQVFKSITMLLCLISIGGYGQKREKTFSERFNVSENSVLEINTSYADIEFDTWNKDEISIEATIELEGVSEEEAKNYFDSEGFEIVGNSKKVVLNSRNTGPWFFQHHENLTNIHVEIPEMPEFESFDFDFDFSDIGDLPSMPPPPNPNFDYEAYKKDGEAYLKNWQKNFEKNFGEPYQKKMEEWQRKMEVKQKEMEKRREKIEEKRMEEQAERIEAIAKASAKRVERQMEAQQRRLERNQKHWATQDSTPSFFLHHDDIPAGSNTFYFKSQGENKNYKVKKTIKIRMPKSTKLKLNVRHGEVKLAESTTNMNATLSHASLFATTIDGDKTTISASYSPVSVEKWNYGQLQADYSASVDLKEVLNLRLNAISSDVTIENLMKTAFIKNDFGPILIKTISKDFETLDISMQNAELFCNLPKTAYTIYVNSTDSDFEGPNDLKVKKTTNHGNEILRGYYLHKDAAQSITLTAKYSEINLN